MSLGKKRMEEEAAAAGSGTAAEPEMVEKDDDERELEKLEKSDPEMLRICLIILEQLEKFKVRLIVEKTKRPSVVFNNIFSVCLFVTLLDLVFALINFALA